MSTKLLKFQEVGARLRLTRQTVYRLLASDPSFPKPIYLAPGVPRFAADDIEAWLASRPRSTGEVA